MFQSKCMFSCARQYTCLCMLEGPHTAGREMEIPAYCQQHPRSWSSYISSSQLNVAFNIVNKCNIPPTIPRGGHAVLICVQPMCILHTGIRIFTKNKSHRRSHRGGGVLSSTRHAQRPVYSALLAHPTPNLDLRRCLCSCPLGVTTQDNNFIPEKMRQSHSTYVSCPRKHEVGTPAYYCTLEHLEILEKYFGSL